MAPITLMHPTSDFIICKYQQGWFGFNHLTGQTHLLSTPQQPLASGHFSRLSIHYGRELTRLLIIESSMTWRHHLKLRTRRDILREQKGKKKKYLITETEPIGSLNSNNQDRLRALNVVISTGTPVEVFDWNVPKELWWGHDIIQGVARHPEWTYGHRLPVLVS